MNRMELIYPETGTNVRVLGTAEAPLFVAADVCAALELTDTTSALRALESDEKGPHTVRTLGGPQELLVVTEPGLYRLIMRSRKPQAKAFARWVTHEVLPSIRRTGSYQSPEGAASSDTLGNRSPRHAELDANLLRADLLTAERILTRPPVADTDTDLLKAGARLLLSSHPSTRTPGRGLDALLPSAPAGAPAVDVAAGIAARLRGLVPAPAGEQVAPVDQVVQDLARRLYGDAETAAATQRYLERVQTAGQLRATADPVLTKAAELLEDLDRPTVTSRVLSFVRTHPGLSGNAVVRGLSLSKTPGARQDISQALRRLEDAGLLRHEPGPRGARLWSPTARSMDSILADELRNPATLPARVLAVVQKYPGATTGHVIRRAGAQHIRALDTLRRLEASGYVRADAIGHARRWTAVPQLAQGGAQ